MNPILAQLGLTPEIIARHVVRIAPAATASEIRSIAQSNLESMRAKRARFLAQGLTTQGKPRRRKSKHAPTFE